MSDKQRLHFLLFFAIVFLVSAYASCRELKYAIWGERQYIGVVVFAGSLALIGFFLFKVLRQAYDY